MRAEGLKRKKKLFGRVFLVSTMVFFLSSTLLTLATMAPEPFPAPTPPDKQLTPSPDPSPDPNPIPDKSDDRVPDNVSSEPPSTYSPSKFVELDTAVMVSIVSLMTSITSLIGFLSTTILAWRREQRDVASSKLEMEKKELELQKLRNELKKSKQSSSNESA